MTVFTCILFVFLIVCAVAASLSRSLLNTVLIFMSYSTVVTLKKIHAIMGADAAEKEAENELEYRRRRNS